MRMTRLSPIPVLTAVLLLAAGAAGSLAWADTVTRGFDVAPGGTLTVDTDRGSIEVRTSGSNRVEVSVERSGDEAAKLKLDFDHRGADVTVTGRMEGAQRWFNWGNQRVKFVITVPERYDVHLETEGGSIQVDDLEGAVEASTSGGSLWFGHNRGPVDGRTSGGSIRLTGSAGDAVLRTSGGSIEIGDVDGQVVAETSGGSIHIDRARGSVKAETSGGSIRVDEVRGAIDASTSGGTVSASITEQPAADCRLSTSGGGVNVALGPGVAVDLDAAASGGGVKSDLPVDAASRSRDRLRGTINGGGPALVLRSSGGGVRITGG
jgi:DUF4097 and DUF4098 domain-containing protein YvlB